MKPSRSQIIKHRQKKNIDNNINTKKNKNISTPQESTDNLIYHSTTTHHKVQRRNQHKYDFSS